MSCASVGGSVAVAAPEDVLEPVAVAGWSRVAVTVPEEVLVSAAIAERSTVAVTVPEDVLDPSAVALTLLPAPAGGMSSRTRLMAYSVYSSQWAFER